MKKNLRITFRYFLVIIVATIMISCSSARKQKKLVTGRSNIYPKRFPKVQGYKVSLEVISSRRKFYAGEKVNITFQLKNRSRKKLQVFEWMRIEPNNIKVYYRPYKKGLKKFVAADWKCLDPKLAEPIMRSTLELNWRNSVLVEKKLPFIRKIKAANLPSGGKKYFVLGELNLMSIKARSNPITITVK